MKAVLMNNINEVITAWRDTDPVTWAQSQYGWITPEGQPITLTAWQSAVVAAWWGHRSTVTTLAISNVKKTGKTLLNSVLLAWRWLALPGVHFAVGNDLDQSTARQYAEIVDMIRRNSFLAPLVKVTGKVLTFEPTGSQLVALAQDAAGNAGANHLTASHTEAWGVLSEGAMRAYEELTPPPGLSWGLPALRILDSYAGYEGESTTWHGIVDRGLTGKRIDTAWGLYLDGGLMLFHAAGDDAQARCYRGSQAEAAAYYSEQRRSLRPNAFARMHENRRVSGEAAFLPEGAWDACRSLDVKPLAEGDGRRVVLGVDASTSRDFTAAVGVWHNPTNNTPDVVLCRVWKPQRSFLRGGKPTIDLAETVGAEVMRLHKAGQLVGVVCDPYQLHSLIVEWQKAGIKVIELPQSSGRVEADQALYDSVISQSIRHYGDPVLTEHIRNAVAIETPRGLRLAKEKTSLKIDAAVALSMAMWGSRETVGRVNRRSTGLMPNPWDCEGDFNADYLYHPDGSFTYCEGGVNKRPHPAGVTWHNCPHRRQGCQVCVDEMYQDGTWDELRQAAKIQVEAEFARPEQNDQSQLIAEKENHNARILKLFWNNARRGQS